MIAQRTTNVESGSILPLIAGLVALALAVIVTVTVATSLYVEHKRLLTFADAAALAAAESFVLDDAIVEGTRVTPVLDPTQVYARVKEFVTTFRDEIDIVEASTHDMRSAVVTLSATWTPPLVSALFTQSFVLTATSRARSFLSIN